MKSDGASRVGYSCGYISLNRYCVQCSKLKEEHGALQIIVPQLCPISQRPEPFTVLYIVKDENTWLTDKAPKETSLSASVYVQFVLFCSTMAAAERGGEMAAKAAKATTSKQCATGRGRVTVCVPLPKFGYQAECT